MTLQVAIVGGGNMGQALSRGILRDTSLNAQVTVADPRAEDLLNEFPPNVRVIIDNRKAIEPSEVVILAVKPQFMESVVEPLRPHIGDKLVVTVAAGIPIAKYQQWLGSHIAMIRCMPNTPSLVGMGVSGLFANVNATAADREIVERLLRETGDLMWVDNEDELHTITALSGSGPAYFFYMMESMIKQGIELGIKPSKSRAIVVQTALGAATLAAQSDEDIQQLRHRITSPRGTTERAIQVFDEFKVDRGIQAGTKSAHQRSIELAESF